MWPYNDCEWNYITHGKKKVKNKNSKLVLLCVLPSIIFAGLLLFVL